MTSFQSMLLKVRILISTIQFASVSECLVWFSWLFSPGLFVYFYILQSNYYRSSGVIDHIIHFEECILLSGYFEFEVHWFNSSFVLLGHLDFLMILRVHVPSHSNRFWLFDVQIYFSQGLFIYSILISQKESYYLLQSFRLLIF